MDPVEYLRVARRRWWIIAVAGLLAVIAVTLTTPTGSSSVQTDGESFTATHTLFLEADRSGDSGGLSLRKAAFFVGVGEVPRRVARDLAFDGPPAVLAAKVATATDDDLGSLEITATDSDAARVVAIADTFAKDLIGYIEDTERARIQLALTDAQAAIANLTAQLAELDARLGPAPTIEQRQNREVVSSALQTVTARATELAAASVRSAFVTFEPAVAVPEGSSAGVFRTPDSRGGRLVIVGLLGLLVGAGFALVIDRLDTSLQTIEAAETAFGLPVLAEIPARDEKRQRRANPLVAAADPRSPTVQPYRMVRTALLLMQRQLDAHEGRTRAPRPNAGRQVVLVTAAGPEEGPGQAMASLAARFAESGRSVLVIGVDPLSTVGRWATEGSDGSLGLHDVLWDRRSRPALVDVVQETPLALVSVIAPGPSSDGSSLALSFDLVTEARTLADIVLVDAGPLLTSSEAGESLGYVDAVVVVARAGRTSVDAAGRIGDLLVRFDAAPAGVVFVGAKYARSGGRRPGSPRPSPGARSSAPADVEGVASGPGRSSGSTAAAGSVAEPPASRWGSAGRAPGEAAPSPRAR